MRHYKNIPEQSLAVLARTNGWVVSKRGWPDFWCWNTTTGEYIAVEVKRRLKNGRLPPLKPAKADCMDFLSSKGIRCFVSDGTSLQRQPPA